MGCLDTMLQEPWDKVAAVANPRQSVSSNLINTNYQLPDGPVKAGRRWGQRHPKSAYSCPVQAQTIGCHQPTLNKQTNKNLRCGNRKGLLGRNDQTHHRMGPKTMESIPPSKRNTQAHIQLRTRQTNHPKSLASQCMSGQPISTCHALTS